MDLNLLGGIEHQELRRLLELFPEAVALTPRADIEAWLFVINCAFPGGRKLTSLDSDFAIASKCM